jgi:hypothetical protein
VNLNTPESIGGPDHSAALARRAELLRLVEAVLPAILTLPGATPGEAVNAAFIVANGALDRLDAEQWGGNP